MRRDAELLPEEEPSDGPVAQQEDILVDMEIFVVTILAGGGLLGWFYPTPGPSGVAIFLILAAVIGLVFEWLREIGD